MEREYNLVNVGIDVFKAQLGDLLLYPTHITMLLQVYENGTGDFIHATRVGKPQPTGGINVKFNRKISNYRGKLIRILRHVKFFEAPLVQPLTQHPTYPARDQNLAVNP